MLDADQNIPFADAAAFAGFLDEHYDRIHAFAWRVLGNREDAEDLTQEICLSLPGKLSNYRGDCKLTTWLYRIVANAAIDALRKKKRAARAAPEWSAALERMAEEGRERTQNMRWLLAAFETLPDELRVTAAMLVEEGLTQSEAADRLGIAPGTVAWRMSEVKRRLQQAAREDDDVA